MAPVNRRGPPPRPQTRPPERISRLARIKLDGAAAWKRKPARRSGAMLANALIIGGAAIAGAAWIGGNLFDTRQALYAGADSLAAFAGLKAEIDVRGVEGQRREEVIAAALPRGRTSIMAASPNDMKTNVESLDWVEGATVSRLWPSTIRIKVTRRDAFALWQEQGVVTVVDAAGERVHGARPSDFPNLPRIVGAGAGPAAEKVLVALEELPGVRAHLSSLVRVGDRRWNLTLRSGAVVVLPEEDPVTALQRLERLQRTHRLLDRDFARLDLREGARVVLTPRPVVATAAQAAGGA